MYRKTWNINCINIVLKYLHNLKETVFLQLIHKRNLSYNKNKK